MRIKSFFKFFYEIFYVFLAMFSLYLIFSKENIYFNFIIYFLFVLDYLYRFLKSENKWFFVRNNPIDFICAFGTENIFRIFRFFRLFFICFKKFKIKRYFEIRFPKFFKFIFKNELGISILWIFNFIVIVSKIFSISENISYENSIWWAITTITTVGYGDISPVTKFGKILAIILMFFGIGTMGLITANIADLFINKKENVKNIFILKEKFEKLNEDSKKKILIRLEQEIDFELFKNEKIRRENNEKF